jgi:hypothetical protein
MCLITRQKKAIILKEDLIVYKLGYVQPRNGKTNFLSILQSYEYALGHLHETVICHTSRTNLCVQIWDCLSLPEGIQRKANLFGKNGLLLPEFISIGKGFHWATRCNRFRFNFMNHYRRIIVECLVPAGSQVYYDDSGLGVSNQIILTKIVEL